MSAPKPPVPPTPTPLASGNLTLRTIAVRVGAEVTEAINVAITTGDFARCERLVLWLDSLATRDAADAAREIARAQRGSDPPPPPDDEAA